ncbi:MAG: hypothetical protein FWE72_05345 [Spirochaetaceae bacterium]|nr:hypothetical protein [Spirochaetaceae bacterium]
MENKKRIIFVFLMLFGILSFIAAQVALPATEPNTASETTQQPETISQSENLSYYIMETETGVRFIQRIEWNPVDYVYRYGIIVEQKDSANKYTEVVSDFSDENSIEISIPAGTYRYKIRAYNLLNRLEGESNWQEFEVFLAIQPEVNNFSPGRFYLDEEGATVITITGRDFVERADVFLVSRPVQGKTQTTTRLSPAQKKIDPSGESAELIFDDIDLKIGMYDVVVQNPGGLKSSSGPFYISFQKPVDLNISIGWTPMAFFNYMPSTDKNFEVVNDALDIPYFLSASMRIAFVPIKKSYGYFGLELAPYASYFTNKKSEGYTVEGFFMGGHVNLIYQKHFIKRKLVGNVRMGGGVSMFYNLEVDYGNGLVSDPFDTWFFSTNVGVSLQYFVTKKVFVELGADYQHNFPESMSYGVVRPGIFVGYQL